MAPVISSEVYQKICSPPERPQSIAMLKVNFLNSKIFVVERENIWVCGKIGISQWVLRSTA